MTARRSCPIAAAVLASALVGATLAGTSAAPAGALSVYEHAPAVAATATAAAGGGADGSVPWDRVLARLPVAARAAAGPATVVRLLKIADGTTVRVEDGSGDATGAVATSYVNVLGSLPHGSELGKLTVRIVPTAALATACGGSAGDGVLACYAGGGDTMVVPADASSAGSNGVSLDYVLAHEYGHHVAAHRSNAPYPSLDFGPKYWASYERICVGTLTGRYAPGDEASAYRRNPGENWAETYARLTFPAQPWTFAPALKPTAGALAAARRDVSDPWTGPRRTRLAGTLDARHRVARTTLTVTLDGAFSVRLAGPRSADFDIEVTAGGKAVGHTSGHAANDVLSFASACRTKPSERVTIAVVRRRGAGPFVADVTYAG
ncbi:MAG: hypothetical protein JWQ48_1679 [Conexibacter sp.]|nr:hypothetical protein [Conexibacter sp.]